MGRIIGIRHRVKQTAEGEARPTEVFIINGDNEQSFKLEDETAELEFIVGRFPISYREVVMGEDISIFKPRHIKWRKTQGDELISKYPREYLSLGDKITVVSKVPDAYDGLRAGDAIAMVLGGSGDRLAYAFSRRGEEIGAKVLRIPPSVLKERRGEQLKEYDVKTLAVLAYSSPELFYQVTPRDRDLIKVSESLRARRDAQKDRIACEQRLRQRFIGRIFLSDSGYYPEGSIEDEYDKMKATDIILRNLIGEEKEREKELRKAVNELNVWHAIFSPIK